MSPDVQAVVTVRPLDRPGAPSTARATPVNADPSRQFAALTMDHEGRFAVHVDVESAAGRVSVDSEVQATYDLRPSRVMLIVYLVPFLLVGLLWTTLLVRRRRARRRRRSAGQRNFGEDRFLVRQDPIQLLLVGDNLVQLGLVALNALLVGDDLSSGSR